MSFNQFNNRLHSRLLDQAPNDDWAPWKNITTRRNISNELLKIPLKPKNTLTETLKARQVKPLSVSTQKASGKHSKLAKSKSDMVGISVRPTKPTLRKMVTNLEAITASAYEQEKSTSLDISFLKNVGSILSKPSPLVVSGSVASPMQSCPGENYPLSYALLETSESENLDPLGLADVVTLRTVPRHGVKLWEPKVGKSVPNIFACPLCDRTVHELDMKISVIAVCGHTFCGDCVLPLSHMKKACPLCRAPATKNDIKEFLIDSKTNVKKRVSL